MVEHNLDITDRDVSEFTSSPELIALMKKNFKRLSRDGAIKLISLITKNLNTINITSIQSKATALLQFNKSKFEEKGKRNYFLKEDVIEELKIKVKSKLEDIGKEISYYDKEQHKGIAVKNIDGNDVYVLVKQITYEKVRKITCDEAGNVLFKYDFNNPDIKKPKPPKTKNTLQRSIIQITSQGQKFGYSTEYKYNCYKCGQRVTKKSYAMIGTKTKYTCEGIYKYLSADGEFKTKVCNTQLYPDGNISPTREAYYYTISYDDEEEVKQSVTAISFERYTPGFYDSVLYKINNPNGLDTFQIMDIKEIQKFDITLPEMSNEENYVFKLQNCFDDFIEKQTGMKIYGLYPIKVALIMQSIFHLINKKIANTQVIGDASTGKSTILKYYGFLLNNHLHYSTNGQSLSIPSLRGTRELLNIMGKEHKIITIGFLGTFKTLHIDEAGDNQELVQHMKTFLLEDNYSYDKAGSNGTFHKRTIQANISQNISLNHIGQYNGMIRKAYKDGDYIISNEPKPEWNESWDLHQPIDNYVDNTYLLKAVMDVRVLLENKRVYWIDGYETALHERFPFYFFLVSEKDSQTLKEIVKQNASRNIISENVELMRALSTDSITNFLGTLKPYFVSEKDKESFDKLDVVLKEYNIKSDSRTNTFYYTLLRASRILNKRMECNEQDFNLVKWLIEKMNKKLDILETIDYSIHGPNDLSIAKNKLDKLEGNNNQQGLSFGIKEEDFK